MSLGFSITAPNILHADAMERSAAFYDYLNEFTVPGCNSLPLREWLQDNGDVCGNVSRTSYRSEDKYATFLHEQDLAAGKEAANARERLARLMPDLSGVQLQRVRGMLAGNGQQETVIRPGNSCHAINRVQRKDKDDLRIEEVG